LELWYREHQCLWLDVKIILLTAIALVWPENSLPLKWLEGLPKRPARAPEEAEKTLRAESDFRTSLTPPHVHP
jgi:hypothetical protein